VRRAAKQKTLWVMRQAERWLGEGQDWVNKSGTVSEFDRQLSGGDRPRLFVMCAGD
jgi:hypothetical protein